MEIKLLLVFIKKSLTFINFPGAETNKVSAMNFYAYRLMIRQDVDNHLLRFRRLLQQYCVDMYVKIETERLNSIQPIEATFGGIYSFA